jgi:autotransporter-associated beta strand protein
VHRFNPALGVRHLACLIAACALAATAQAQTTLNATLSSTPWTNTSSLSTGSGLTINLGLGFEYLIVGGGGGGGNGTSAANEAGGGGAGGVRTGSTPFLPSTTPSVTVGGGGLAGANGSNSSLSTITTSTITALGGGFGGSSTTAAGNGGSGGGGSHRNSGGVIGGDPGTGTPGQGTDGGRGALGKGGGGGGAGETGNTDGQGYGGDGMQSSITGTATFYGGGGAGANNPGAVGGEGGGGSSPSTSGNNGGAGSDNLGGGGGGGFGSSNTGGRGGSGVVIVRYRSATDFTSGGNTSGSYTADGDTWQFERFIGNATTTVNSTLTVNAYTVANLLATQSGAISGTGGLSFNSPGTLNLTAANTFSGTTRVQAGTFNLGNANALQNSTLDMNATDTGTVNFTVAGTNSYTLGSLAGSRNLPIGVHSLSLGGNNATTTFSGNLTAGSLTKTGTGSLTLSGSNSISGTATVSAGTLVAGNASALGAASVPIIAAGGVLDLGGSSFTRTGNVSITGGTVQSGTLTHDTVAFDGQSGTVTAVLAGASGLAKTGSGRLILAGNNTYSGTTAISAGTLQVGNGGSSGSLGTGRVVFSATGATLAAGSSLTIDNAIDLSSNGTINSGSFALTAAGSITGPGQLTKAGSGSLTLSGTSSHSGGTVVAAGRLIGTTASLQGSITNDSIVVFDQASTGTFAGTMSGVGAMQKSGVGTVVLTSANNNTGGATINAGTLAVTADAALGTPGAGTGVIFGTGAGANPASGTARDANWSLVAVPSTWTPPTSLPYSAYVVQSVPSIFVGGTNSSGVQNGYTTSGTTVYWIAPQPTTAQLVGTTYNWIVAQEFNVVRDGVYSFTFGGAGDDRISFYIDGAVNTTNSVLPVISGGTQIGTTWSSLTTIGTLTGSASLTAGTHTAYMVLEDIGGNTGAIITPGSFTPPAGTIVEAGATLDLRNVTYATNDLVTLKGATLAASTGTSSWAGNVVTTGSSIVSVDGTSLSIAGVVRGTGSFAKTGAGNLILSGSSSYAGATSVAAGRLSVNGALGNSAVAVLAAAELGGSGSIAGPVSIAAGGTLSPGNSIASLATGTTTFAAGATFEYEVDSSNLGDLSTAADLLVVNGDLNIANGTLLTFLDLDTTPQYFPEDTTIFALINYAGTWNGGLFTYGANVLSDGERFYAGSQQWEIDYNRPSPVGLANFTGDYLPSSNFVAITAVPEPGTLVLAGVGAGLAGLMALRRKRQTHRG